MRTGRFGKGVAVLLVVVLGAFATGCFGKFQLTRKVYDINQSVEEPYVRSAVTWVFVIVPVYGIAGLLDFLIFNTIEFWSGENPVARGPVTRVYAQGSGKAVLTLDRDGAATAATIRRYEGETLVSTLRIRDEGNGAVTAVETADGKKVREIAAIRGDDGSVEVTMSTARAAAVERYAAPAVRTQMGRVARIASEARQAASGPVGTIPTAAAKAGPASGG
jgi:hypothetical protein